MALGGGDFFITGGVGAWEKSRADLLSLEDGGRGPVQPFMGHWIDQCFSPKGSPPWHTPLWAFVVQISR